MRSSQFGTTTLPTSASALYSCHSMAKPLGFMYALGLDGLPNQIEVRGIGYVLEREQKHDFWAATGFYRRATPPADDKGADDKGVISLSPPSTDSSTSLSISEAPDEAGSKKRNDPFFRAYPRIVAKFNRQTSFMGLPLRWIGRWLRNRERRAYAKLQAVPGIPALLGDVTDTGFVHEYVEGEPLHKGLALPDDYFPKLLALIDTLRDRGIAYVDSNKPQNILLGDDGLPYLIDFQISFDANAWWPRWLGRKWLAIFHDADVYHVLKQKRRFRPDQLTDAERHRVEHRTILQKLHRGIGKPYFAVRRPLMRWLERSGRAQKKGSD